MDTFLHDIRFGIRLLFKSPVFALVALLSLALGIGANTAIFSLVNALLLRPLPIDQPAQVVSVYTATASGMAYGSTSFADYLDYRNHSDIFSGLAASKFTLASVRSGSENEVVPAMLASGNYFSVLGVKPRLGRGFTPEEDQKPGGGPVMVISYSYWERRFASDPEVINKTVHINGHPFTIIGVAPENFTGTFTGINPDLWVPVTMQPRAMPGRGAPLQDRRDRWLDLMGRLKPGVSVEQAQAALNTAAAQLDRAFPDGSEGRTRRIAVARAGGVHPGFRGPVIAFTGVLMVIVGIGLLIACANVANLLLARATARRKEISIRLALGAGRRRLIRQMLTESILLSLFGGGVGLLFAMWTGKLIMLFKPPTPIPISINLSLDIPVLVFALVASILTGIVFGLAPAVYSTRTDLVGYLKGETPALGRRRKLALSNLLVVAQITLSVVLLIAASFLLRSLWGLRSVDLGLRTNDVALVWLDLNLGNYPQQKGRDFYSQLVERVGSLPGVRNVSLSSNVPLGLSFGEVNISIEGRQPPPQGSYIQAGHQTVEANYFQTIGIPLSRGREFNNSDIDKSTKVVIANETMARRFWPGEDPIGKRIQLTPRPSPQSDYYEVIGIVKDSKYVSFGEDPRAVFYRAFTQIYNAEMNLLVQTSSDPSKLLTTLRQETLALDPYAPILAVKTMEENMGTSLLPWKLATLLSGAASLIVLALAAIGIYGVVSYSVGQRLKEIGIRLALGAQRSDILKIILAQGCRYAAIGVLIGVAISLLLARLLSGVLFGVHTIDPVTFLIIPALLAFVVLLASYAPARRATKVDPMIVLRNE